MIKQKAIILSISSDIAYAIALNLLKKNIKVFGTYRTVSNKTRFLKKKGAILFKLDLLKEKQINSVCNKIMNFAKDWNIFIGSAGTLEPIEKIIQSNNDKWQNSISINSLSQIIFLKNLLFNNKRKRKIIFFAGSGTNDATPYYSAYTLSKIILIKFVELLDSEEKLLNVVILGPGWVKTKIHKSTLNSKLKYLKNRKKTKEILLSANTTKFDEITNFINWTLSQPKKIISGRNFSLKGDMWGSKNLNKILLSDTNIYKLRRYKNKIKI